MSLVDLAIGAGVGYATGSPQLGAATLGYLGQESANSANAAAADKQMAFQEEMSNTAYQRQVKDLQAAGLNPMLAYIKGGGASTPAGAMPTYQNSGAAASQSYLASAQGVKSSAEANKVAYDIDNVVADTALKVAQSGKTEADTVLVGAMTKKAIAEVDLVDSQMRKTNAEITNIELDRGRIKALINNLNESSALMSKQGMTEVQRQSNLEASTQQLVVAGKITQAEYDAMKNTGFVGVIARETKVLSDIGSEWVDKIIPWRGSKMPSSSEDYPKGSSYEVKQSSSHKRIFGPK